MKSNPPQISTKHVPDDNAFLYFLQTGQRVVSDIDIYALRTHNSLLMNGWMIIYIVMTRQNSRNTLKTKK